MCNAVRRLTHDKSGAATVEYSLIVVVVSVSAIAGMEAFGSSLIEVFQYISQSIDAVIDATFS